MTLKEFHFAESLPFFQEEILGYQSLYRMTHTHKQLAAIHLSWVFQERVMLLVANAKKLLEVINPRLWNVHELETVVAWTCRSICDRLETRSAPRLAFFDELNLTVHKFWENRVIDVPHSG